MNDASNGGNYVDFNQKYNYLLQWIDESRSAREAYQCLLYRVALAQQGKPWKNLYQLELESNLAKIKNEKEREACKRRCLEVPEGKDFTLLKAIQNRANQMASGVDTYEYEINDPYMICDSDTEALLAAKCEQDYELNHLGMFAPTFSRDLTTAGITAAIVEYCPIKDKTKIYRISPKNIFFDTKYSSTGQERFRGYNVMISWKKLKKMIESDPNEEINLDIKAPDRSIFTEDKKHIDENAKYSNRKIRSLNGLDVYVDTMNRLAASPELARDADSYLEFRHDLLDCYNTNWYQTYATDMKARTNNDYNGDDVELTVMYDLTEGCEFKIINRRYVISKNESAFKRKILFPITNPVTGEVEQRIDDFELPCPLKFQYDSMETRDTAAFPVSVAMKVLDLHDQLCAWRAKREHVANILSILRIETNGGDAESLRGILNVMGIVLDDIQGDINSINFQYDWTAIDSQIAYLQQEIKTVLSGYDEFDAMQMMGDRASAAESGMAIGAVAQGLATHQNAVMQIYADIARQCIANRVAYSPAQEFPVVNNGNYSTLTIQEMALNATIKVKSKLSKKVQEKMLAANAMTILGSMKDILKPAGMAYFAEQAMYGSAPRKMLEEFINIPQASPAAQQTAALEAQNMANQLSQNEQAYQAAPVDYEAANVMENPENTPEDIDAIIAGLGGGGMQAAEPPISDLGGAAQSGMPEAMMTDQEGSVVADLPNQTPDTGSMMANANSLV